MTHDADAVVWNTPVRTLGEVLQRTAQTVPTKDAYRFNGVSLTYGDLITAAGQMATALQKVDCQKGDRIGLFLPQSLDLPIALYGVLFAGAAFVPIDPLAPKERVRQILEKCGIRTVITGQRQAQVLARISAEGYDLNAVLGTRVAGIPGAEWGEIAGMAESEPVRLSELDLAYIMFTSGSTGAPKGMVHTHGNGLIYADNLVHYHQLHSGDRFLNLSPLHFDMAIMDHVAAVMVGGTTIIVPEAVARLPASLTALAADERASVWYSVPFAMTEMLLRGGMADRDLSALRWMIYGGEAFALRHLRALQAALPNAQFCNAYGPAETHQVSSFDIPPLPEGEDYVIPIGRPWRTVDVLVVDDNDTPVGIGEPGELLVRAPSCMRGYWGEPERSAAAFYYRSVDGHIADRYYRTGDIVVMQADAMMYFHGRKDRQIKLRGNRVELDEVEAVLSQCPNISECAVIKDASGTRLIAAVSLAAGAEMDAGRLRALARQHLPPYAVPATYVEIDEFPRTGSRKIDRIALAHKLANKGHEGEMDGPRE